MLFKPAIVPGSTVTEHFIHIWHKTSFAWLLGLHYDQVTLTTGPDLQHSTNLAVKRVRLLQGIELMVEAP